MAEALRVPQAEVETAEEDCFFEAVYQGRPFTGIAWSDEDGEYSEISYVDGTAHGRCFTRFANGALSSEEWVEQGRTVWSNAWWPPGKILWRRHQPGLTQYFYKDGALGIERKPGVERYFYESGVLRQEQVRQADGPVFRYYGPDGGKAAEWRQVQDGLRWREVGFVFQDAYIQAHYLELLEDTDFERCFQNWFLQLPEDGRDACEILCRLAASENLRIRYFCAALAGAVHAAEAEAVLNTLLSQEVCPPPVRRLDGMGHAYGRTIAEAARRALAARKKMGNRKHRRF